VNVSSNDYEARSKREDTDQERLNPERQADTGQGQMSPHLLRGSGLGHSANVSVRIAAMQNAQRTYGNRAVQRYLSQQTESAKPESDDIATRIGAKSGGGSPIHPGTLALIEESLGADLSGVRVHTDAEADTLARSVDSIAFTSGQDIFFRSGAYDPQSGAGLRLLAHEATHTVQQAQGPVEGTPSEGGVSISDPSDSFEQEAERVADKVSSSPSGSERQAPGFANSSSTGTNQRTTGASKAIQRFVPPDEEWEARVDYARDNAMFNSVKSLPGLGNIASLAGAATAGGSSLLSYLQGDEEEATNSRRVAMQHAYHMIPFIGNGAAFQDARQDWGAYSDMKAGKAGIPSTAEEKWHEETAPAFEKGVNEFIGPIF